ncbi:MAG TPA: thiamine phosphate synthase [Solirubrobacteraceae bacterium]|nr:thiamine phosphate synthase [Solirubrobacteraceae bacterium]
MAPGEQLAERRARLEGARLYLVCDGRPGGRTLGEVLPGAIAGGVDVVQLREKDASGERLLALAREARELCASAGALFVLNDDPWVAREAGADGVHVGQEDMPVAGAREIVGPEVLVGLSTHAPGEIDAASRLAREGDPGAPDYIGVGPVHATPTKPGRAAVGVELVRHAAAHAGVAFFAIGGLDAGNVGEVIDAGATRVCVLRTIAEASDPEGAARELRAALGAGTASVAG